MSVLRFRTYEWGSGTVKYITNFWAQGVYVGLRKLSCLLINMPLLWNEPRIYTYSVSSFTPWGYPLQYTSCKQQWNTLLYSLIGLQTLGYIIVDSPRYATLELAYSTFLTMRGGNWVKRVVAICNYLSHGINSTALYIIVADITFKFFVIYPP